MNAAQSAVVLLVTGAALANLAIFATRTPRRNLLAWAGGYAAWMATSWVLATSGGQAAPFPWEVWPVSCALFAVMGFPMIVWRYLLRV